MYGLILRTIQLLYSTWLVLGSVVHWLSFLLLDTLRPGRPSLAGLPEHVGIVIGVGEAPDTPRVAALVGWCAGAGIGRLTLCDPHGELLDRVDALRAELAARGTSIEIETETRSLPSAPAAVPGAGVRPLRLRVVSSHSGRAELVDAARALCADARDGRLRPDSINEASIDAALSRVHQTPEVGLVLQYCDEPLLGGLLPWHTRIAHYVHMGRLRNAREAALYRALRECSGVTQRHGA